MPLNVVTSQHVHKVVQVRLLVHFPWFLFTQIFPPLLFTDVLNLLCQVLGESLHLASECLTQEAKVAFLASRMEALKKENATLKKDLIESMDEAATLKEKVKALNSDLRVKRQLNLEKDD